MDCSNLADQEVLQKIYSEVYPIKIDDKEYTPQQISAFILQKIKKHNLPHFFDVGNGVCHQVLMENGLALPGTIVV